MLAEDPGGPGRCRRWRARRRRGAPACCAPPRPARLGPSGRGRARPARACARAAPTTRPRPEAEPDEHAEEGARRVGAPHHQGRADEEAGQAAGEVERRERAPPLLALQHPCLRAGEGQRDRGEADERLEEQVVEVEQPVDQGSRPPGPPRRRATPGPRGEDDALDRGDAASVDGESAARPPPAGRRRPPAPRGPARGRRRTRRNSFSVRRGARRSCVAVGGDVHDAGRDGDRAAVEGAARACAARGRHDRHPRFTSRAHQ